MLYKRSVKFSPYGWRNVRSAMAALMLLMWLATLALAAVPELHHRLHADSQDAQHHCLITLLQKQSALSASVALVSPAPLVLEDELVLRPATALTLNQDCPLLPSRAPPVSTVIPAVVG